jgi:hypothetical protein
MMRATCVGSATHATRARMLKRMVASVIKNGCRVLSPTFDKGSLDHMGPKFSILPKWEFPLARANPPESAKSRRSE